MTKVADSTFFIDRENPIYGRREFEHDPAVLWTNDSKISTNSGNAFGTITVGLEGRRITFRRLLNEKCPLLFERTMLKIGLVMVGPADAQPVFSAPDPFAVCTFFQRYRLYFDDSGQDLFTCGDGDLAHIMYAQFQMKYSRSALESHPAIFAPLDDGDALKFTRLSSEAADPTGLNPATVDLRVYNLREYCPSTWARYQKYVNGLAPHNRIQFIYLPLSDLINLKGFMQPARALNLELDVANTHPGAMFSWSDYVAGVAPANDTFTVLQAQMRITSIELFETALEVNPEFPIESYPPQNGLFPFLGWKIYRRTLIGESGEIIIPNLHSIKSVMILMPSATGGMTNDAVLDEVIYSAFSDYQLAPPGANPGRATRTYRFRAVQNTADFSQGLLSIMANYGTIHFPVRPIITNTNIATEQGNMSEPFYFYKHAHELTYGHPVFSNSLSIANLSTSKGMICFAPTGVDFLRLTTPADLRLLWTATPGFQANVLVLVSSIRVLKMEGARMALLE